ncbi:MAG: DUF6221 family protein [Arthrobacter sp.]|nr:DUF6221 family protein [Arthrobacter sp.]
MDIVEFLSERISEDEAAARTLLSDVTVSKSGEWYEQRLLLECEAKRRLIGVVEAARQSALTAMVSDSSDSLEESHWAPRSLDWMERSLQALALPYFDHPDFEQGWLHP